MENHVQQLNRPDILNVPFKISIKASIEVKLTGRILVE